MYMLAGGEGGLILQSSGDQTVLETAAARWLQTSPQGTTATAA
jgi:glutamate racemase